jgi:hypothetical protein
VHPIQLAGDLRLVRGLVMRGQTAAACAFLAMMAVAYARPHRRPRELFAVPAFVEGTLDRSIGSIGTPWLFARALCDVGRALARDDHAAALGLIDRISHACGPRPVRRARPRLRLLRRRRS